MALRAGRRVLIADAQPVFGYGLRRLLEEAGGFEVVAQATGASEALELSASLRPDLAFLDCALLDPEYGTLAQMADDGGDGGAKVVLWAPGSDAAPLLGALRLGARGILARTAPSGLIEKAARCVAAGQYWIGREAVGDLVRWLCETSPMPRGRAKSSAPDTHLTAREREVVAAVAAGRCNKEIAARLSICEDTVKHHLSSIFGKLGVSTRLELAIFAMRNRPAEKAPTSSV